MTRVGQLLLTAMIVVASMAACSSSSPDTSGSPSATPLASGIPTPSQAKCDLPKAVEFPAWVPKNLPLPDGTFASQRLPSGQGYFRGIFITPVSTTDFARFALSRWPKSGWQLGKGDAEPGEAEDTFLKGQAFGAFKVQDMACRPPHSTLLLVYGPDRSKAAGISTQPGSPLPDTSPEP